MQYHMSGTLAIVIAMLVMDWAWLSSTSVSTKQMFARLQGQPLEFKWIPAALTYLIMTAAIYFFAVEPADTWITAAGRGAAMGFVMYGVYDFTNYATLAKYPLSFALTDLAWGTFMCATVAAIGKYAS
jgi:uncharacterized membrane protein